MPSRVFGPQAIQPAVESIEATLTAWRNSTHLLPWQVRNTTIDVLLSNNSPRLEDVREPLLQELLEHYRSADAKGRRSGLFKISRVLANKGIIASPPAHQPGQGRTGSRGPRYGSTRVA